MNTLDTVPVQQTYTRYVVLITVGYCTSVPPKAADSLSVLLNCGSDCWLLLRTAYSAKRGNEQSIDLACVLGSGRNGQAIVAHGRDSSAVGIRLQSSPLPCSRMSQHGFYGFQAECCYLDQLPLVVYTH